MLGTPLHSNQITLPCLPTHSGKLAEKGLDDVPDLVLGEQEVLCCCQDVGLPRVVATEGEGHGQTALAQVGDQLRGLRGRGLGGAGARAARGGGGWGVGLKE